MTVVVAVSFLASRVNIATPLVLVAAGIALTAVPSLRHIEIDPEWILAGILPPLLYSTSTRLPVMDFRRDLPAISGLSVVLVVITSLSVGWLMSMLIPEVGFATGVAIGAVVSLLIQGGTLGPLVRRLGLTGNLTDRSEIESLISTMQVAGEKYLDSPDLRRADGSKYDADLVERMKTRTQSRADLRPAADDPEGIDRANQTLELRIAVLDAERRRLLEIRRAGTAPSQVLSELMNVLDADQISLELRRREPGPMD